MNRHTCIGILALASILPASAAPANEEALARIEAKWGGVMTKIRGWNGEALRQFREGYKDYPPEVLEKALAARSFEKMLGALDAHATVKSQKTMQKATKVHAMAETLPEDADNAQVTEARQLLAKSLGDDARDLVFIPVTPCTVWDTRFATDPNSAGIIGNAQTKRFYTHLDGAGGSYAAWGGNPTCPETAQNAIGLRPFAVMTTVYTSDASIQGWLTLYRDGDADPSLATISVYYSPGPTRTQTVITKSNRGYGSGTYDVAATSRFGSVNASASITGYFLKVTDGYVTEVNADPPLASSGGPTPTIGFAGPANGTVLATNGGVTTFTGSPTLSGNIELVNSSPTAGNIVKGGNRFLHNQGSDGTFLGALAGSSVTGGGNTGIGALALRDLTSGNRNTAIGGLAQFLRTAGADNTAVGHGALASNTSGNNNTVVGASAGQNIQGSSNTLLGLRAMQNNAFGNSNIVIGQDAGFALNGSSNILIGNAGAGGDNATIRIGTPGGQTSAYVAGVRGATTTFADAVNVMVDSLGQLGTVSSSAAVKENVADMGAASSALMHLRPVTFDYRSHQAGSRLQYGLIAEEVDKVYPGLVAKRADGSAETVMYQFLPPMLLNEVQKHERTIAELKAEVAELKRLLMEVRR